MTSVNGTLNASQQAQSLRFSSITQKTPNVEDQNPTNPLNQRKIPLSNSFRDLTSRQEFSRLVDYQPKDDHKLEEMRVHLTYPEKSDVTLSMIKKSKQSGKLLTRNALFTPQKQNVLQFSQDKNKKVYVTPKIYYPETRAQYDAKMKDATTSVQKKKILPWATGDVGDFRITFVRRPAQGQTEAVPDSAFYFKQQSDWDKTKNYFKSIELLEARKDLYSHNGLFDRLAKGFKGYFAARVRNMLGQYAKQVKTELRYKKEDAVHRNVRFFSKIQRDAVKSFVDYWKDVTVKLDNQKQTEQRSIKNRQEHILQTVQRVSILRDLDSYLVGAVLEAWKNEAEERIESPKQDITLYFETLELTGLIVQPVMKVEILIGNQYPTDLIVNQKALQKTNDMVLDYDLNCKLKGLKNNNVFYWKLSHKQGARDNDPNIQTSEDHFSIHFEDFLVEHLDNVQVKINIFDESAAKKAYHYASLRSFYEARKGNNIWLCLDKSYDIDKFPLLQMKVDAGFVDQAHRTYTLGPFVPPAYHKDTITDPFYGTEFNIPTITPKHEKFLTLLPQRWNIVDEKVKELKRSGKLGEYVQNVKTRFAKHYYETSAKQIARLKKTAYLWAELQEELIINSQKQLKGKANNDNSQLCADEKYINNLEGLQRPMIEEGHDDFSRDDQPNELNEIVSYLFKRDKWESKKEWKTYFTQLQELCRKGIPPQSRLSLWSELGRVVYFINLTKNEHKKHRAFQRYSNVNLPENNMHASHDENLAERSQRVYETLKSDAEREYIFLYQELEEDLEILRTDLGIEKRKRIPHEQHIRDICRTFIYWAKLFSDPGRGENIKYHVVYSRAILILCHGLITCQSCNYLDKEADVQEDQIFWLLISLASYIVSSYFETNETQVSVDKLTNKGTDTTPVNRAKNKITNSGLRCSQLKGIKCDLLILKILLKDNENEVFSKFEELGLPFEYYFAEHMLTLFINLFNPGLTFRIWDVLFFEGSSSNQVRCNRMMISFLYVLLRECKPMIMKAKNAVDIKFIIETYARFQTRHGAFIREAYKIAQVHFEQTLPDNEKVLDKLSYIKYALFTLKYNILDNKVNAIEKTIQENYFNLTLKQNIVVWNLANNKYSYKPHGQLESLTYAVLAKMIKDFQNSYGTKRLLSTAIGLNLNKLMNYDPSKQQNFNQSPQGNRPDLNNYPRYSPTGTGNLQQQQQQNLYNQQGAQGHFVNAGYDMRNSQGGYVNPNEGFEPRNSYNASNLNNSQYRNSPTATQRNRINVNAGGDPNLMYGSTPNNPNNLNVNYGQTDLNRSSPLRNQNQQGPTDLGNRASPLRNQNQQGPLSNLLGPGQFQGQGQQQPQGVVGLDGRVSYDPNRSPQRPIQDVVVDPRKFLKGKINSISFKIHKLILYSPNLNTLAMYVIYGKDKVKKQDFSSLEIDFDHTFPLTNVKEATRYINIEIFDEKDPKNPQKIKYLNIDLKRIILDTPTKLNLKFKEENPYIYNDNFITSEVELTILLNGPGFKTGANFSNFPVVPELENPIYDYFRDLRLGEEIPPTLFENEHHKTTPTPNIVGHSFSQNRYAWKENFAVNFEEFMSIMKSIAPFWIANTNFREIFEVIKSANRNGTFYITDFFILLILCGKFTSTQKFRLLFDLLTGFDDAIPDSKNEMAMHTMRGLCAHIYNLFMLYMPYNELENLVDLATTGNLPAIKKVIINDQTSANTDLTKQFLNRLSNYIHLNFNTREIHLYHPQILSLLREYYEKEILTAASTRSLSNNKVEITYITNGMAHKIKIETNSNWEIIGDPKITRGTVNAQPIQPKTLDLYKHVIALQNAPAIYDRPTFIRTMQKLPLLNYLCSLEHSEVSNVLTELGNNIRFTIFMRGEPVYTAIPSIEEINKHVLPDTDPNKKLKKFSSLIRDWDDVVKTCNTAQPQASNRYRGDNRNARRYAIEAKKLPATKLNIFFSYDHTIAYLKRTIIKAISGYIDKQMNVNDQFNASLFNKNLYDLEYNVSLNIDNEKDIKVTDKSKSPFKTLIEKLEAQGSAKEIRNLEVIFNIEDKTIKETFADNYDQLALYRYADGSTEWLPCKLKYKFQYLKNLNKKNTKITDDNIDGFGVIFERYPEETIVKRKNDVAIIQQVDFVELETRQVDPATMKALVVTGNQYAEVEADKRRVVKSSNTGVFKGGVRRRYNASDFDEGDGRLPTRPTTWEFISDDSHKIVKKGDPGIYKGAARRHYNAGDLFVDDGKIKRLATAKDDLRHVKRGQPGQYRGLKRTNFYAGDLVEENYQFARDTSQSTPPQSKNTLGGRHNVGSGLRNSPSLQRGLTNNAKRVVLKGEPGKYKGTEKEHFHAGELEDELAPQTHQPMYQSGSKYGQYDSPQKRPVNYEQQLKKSGSPGIYQGMERRSYNAGSFDEIDENVRGGFDVRQKDYNVANLDRGYEEPYPRDQYYDNRDPRSASQYGNAQNQYSPANQNARPGDSGLYQSGKRNFNSGLPDENDYTYDNRNQYNNYDRGQQGAYTRDQGSYQDRNRFEDENLYVSGNYSQQTGAFGTRSHQVAGGYQSGYQSGYQDRYQSNSNTRGGYAAETDEIVGRVNFNR